ncbi:hypothetical protein HQ533_02085 [Candidatus Woesearchaeota archaeon]|nr:hypothetical protein [Candidatus Woesearchaeota archaeon]
MIEKLTEMILIEEGLDPNKGKVLSKKETDQKIKQMFNRENPLEAIVLFDLSSVTVGTDETENKIFGEKIMISNYYNFGGSIKRQKGLRIEKINTTEETQINNIVIKNKEYNKYVSIDPTGTYKFMKRGETRTGKVKRETVGWMDIMYRPTVIWFPVIEERKKREETEKRLREYFGINKNNLMQTKNNEKIQLATIFFCQGDEHYITAVMPKSITRKSFHKNVTDGIGGRISKIDCLPEYGKYNNTDDKFKSCVYESNRIIEVFEYLSRLQNLKFN